MLFYLEYKKDATNLLIFSYLSLVIIKRRSPCKKTKIKFKL